MNWTKILWWVLTNIPELYGLVKQIIDLLKEAGEAPTSKAAGRHTLNVKTSKGKAQLHARMDIRH